MTYPDPFVDHDPDCDAPCCCIDDDCKHLSCEPGIESLVGMTDDEFDALIAEVQS